MRESCLMAEAITVNLITRLPLSSYEAAKQSGLDFKLFLSLDMS